MKRVLLLFVLLITVGIAAFAQTHTVTGKILDENGQGYSGAGISVKGMAIGTVSDANGDFMLDVPDGNNIFVIQAGGYTSQQVKETDGVVSVKLRAIAKELEGAVNVAQGFKKDKRELGYDATNVDYEDLTVGNNSSAISGLAGKVAGVDITSTTGGPGGSTCIVSRGDKSFLKDNNMLIVVDGVITNNYDRTQSLLQSASSSFSQLSQVDFGNSANDIDPEEIESITVLEGASATVLYGAAGANGALIITTKTGRHNVSGKNGKMEITYKATYTQSDVLKFADVQHSFGQGNMYTGDATDRSTNLSWGTPFDGIMRPWGQEIDNKILSKTYVDQPNNISSFYNHGQDLNNFVSLAGGSESSTYYLGLNSVNSTGVIPNTFYNRYGIRFNGSTQLSNHFYSSVNINYINTYARASGEGNGPGSALDAVINTPRDIPLWELKNLGNKFYSQQFTDTGGVERYGQYNAFYKNPFWIAQNYDNRNQSNRVLGDVKIGYKKGEFNVYDRLGADVSSDMSTYKSPTYNGQPVDASYAGNNFVSNGGYTQSNYSAFRLYNDLIGNYTHQLSNNFGLTAILGNNVSMAHDVTLAGIIDPSTNGLVIPNFYNLQNNIGPVIGYNSLVNQRSVAAYADISLNYQKELFLDITGRNEWSSTLITHNNSYFYPGTNAAWVFTDRLPDGGFKQKVLNYGKFRIGAGGVGNTAVPYANNNAGFTQGAINTGYGTILPPFNGVPAYQVTNTFGDQMLKPERTRDIELGTDLSFLKNRITGSFTYYNSLSYNLIALVPLPPSSGFTGSYENVGTVSNKGIQLGIKGTPISTKYGLKWDLFGTYTHNVNNVVSLNNGVSNVVLGGSDNMEIVAAAGHEYGSFYGNTIQTWTDPKTGISHTVVDPATGLPVATKTPQYLGSFQPKFQASWGTEVSFKGLKLHALFTTKQGGVFYSQTKAEMDMNGTSQETTVNNRNSYVWNNSVYLVPNTPNSYLTNTTKFSPFAYYNATESQNLPGQNLVNASYIRLQELSLSYHIPQKYYKKSPFGSLEAGLFGNNLLLWTAKSNKYDDPEASVAGATGNGQGFNYIAYPTLRNYGAFIKVLF